VQKTSFLHSREKRVSSAIRNTKGGIPMNRRDFLQTVAGMTTTMLYSSALAEEPVKEYPNIVVLVADDAGYSDFSCYGSKNINTPHIDQLAKEGIRFTDFYAAAPNCSPSRAGLLTGRIPARTGVYSYIDYGSPMHLSRKEVTIATLLKQRGYETCVSGKWHLNGNIQSRTLPQPNDHGFDHWFCTDLNAKPSHKDPVNFYQNGEKIGKVEGYSCQIVVDEAINWLKERNKEKPFFLYLPFHEPHVPIASPPELMAKHTGTKEEKSYYANIENMDIAVGKIIDYLDKANLKKNTLVIFFSDNGGTKPASNYPLRGRKSNIWDGGIRVPGIMRWPGHIKPGTLSAEPLSAIDILPTICEISGISPPDDRTIDGTSILPVFEGKTIRRKTPLFWFFYRVAPSLAMREGDWMLIGYLEKPNYEFTHPLRPPDITYIKNSKIVRFALFNIREDIGQKRDISQQQPERLRQMREKMIALHREVLAEGPTWSFHKKEKRR
jgi:arylsulfatase A